MLKEVLECLQPIPGLSLSDMVCIVRSTSEALDFVFYFVSSQEVQF